MPSLGSDRMLQIERGIVNSMEREVRALVREKHRQAEAEERRNAMARRQQALEERREQEREMVAEQRAQKSAKSHEIRQRVQRNLEEDQYITRTQQIMRQERALEKQEILAAKRDAERESKRMEHEAKRQYMADVKAMLEVKQEQKKNDTQAKYEYHQEMCKKCLDKKDIENREKTFRQHMKEERNLQRRAQHKLYQDEQRQLVQERLKKKYDQAEQVRMQNLSDYHHLCRMKEDFALKSAEIQKIIEQAARSGNLHEAEAELAKLKEHQAQMLDKAHDHRSGGSPSMDMTPMPMAKQRPQTARSSPASATMMSPSPTMPGFLRRKSGSISVVREASPPRRLDLHQSPASGGYSEESPQPGSIYSKLMGLYRERGRQSPYV